MWPHIHIKLAFKFNVKLSYSKLDDTLQVEKTKSEVFDCQEEGCLWDLTACTKVVQANGWWHQASVEEAELSLFLSGPKTWVWSN